MAKPRHAALVAKMRAENPGLTTVDAVKAVDQVFEALRQMGRDERIRIPGFGTFHRKFRGERQVRNPRTGETSIKAAHHVITFKEARPK